MEAMSLSVRVDAGVIEHNNRNFIAKNVNKDKVADNISYVKKDIKEMYQELFSEALNKYNAKQTRSDRVIKDYYEHIVNGNQEKPFYEAVIQFGNMDNAKVGTEGGEIAKKMLDEYMKNFQKRNPNLVVFNAVMHLDEATPHLHISFIPVAHNQSRGLETRVSLKKALEELNVSAKTKKLTERQQWAAQEKEIMKTIAKKFGLGIENKNIHRQHLSVEEYKVMQDEMKAAQKKLKTLYEKSDISPKKLKEDDMNLILNNTKLLKKELEEKDKRIMDLEKKVAADFVFLKVGDEQKISFVSDELRKEGVNVVDDLEGIHVPQYAVDLAREIGKKYKPVPLTWRKELALTIDRLIYMSKDLDELLQLLKEKGYIIRRGKYISIKPENIPDARAVRTKTLGNEYTEENLIKRISEKYSYSEANEENIKTSTGIKKEYYIEIRKTVNLIFVGRKIPKKLNSAVPYTVNNDWHINELTSQIAIINREHINSAVGLANFIEKGSKKIAELQASAAEVQEMQNGIRDVISKAEFYFANKDKGGDSMFIAKLAAAKQTIEKFNLAKIEELTPLKARYSDNIKNLAEFNAKMKETQKKQGELLHLQETYQAISTGNYLSKEKEQQEKEQDKSKK